MRKFTAGLVAGGLLGAVGISLALGDKGARKKIIKSGKRALHDAADALDDVKSKLW